MKPNGGSAVTGVLEINGNGTLTPSTPITGSYSIDGLGRGTINVTTPSSVLGSALLTVYAADNNRAVYIESGQQPGGCWSPAETVLTSDYTYAKDQADPWSFLLRAQVTACDSIKP